MHRETEAYKDPFPTGKSGCPVETNKLQGSARVTQSRKDILLHMQEYLQKLMQHSLECKIRNIAFPYHLRIIRHLQAEGTPHSLAYSVYTKCLASKRNLGKIQPGLCVSAEATDSAKVLPPTRRE
jgi:hypothetical protein